MLIKVANLNFDHFEYLCFSPKKILQFEMRTLKQKANTPLINSVSPGSAKRQRVGLTIDQKRSICDNSEQNRKASREAIANHFTNVFKLDKKIGRSTISDILKNQAKFEDLNCSPYVKRLRQPKFEHLERCLMVFGNDLASHNIPICDEMYIEQAKKFGEDIGISKLELSYSRG